MGKSRNGGTRSFIRGRIGSDVYSIGKDAKGKKQQVVRSLAEQVANPQTTAQMRGRMIMSTIMQAVSAMSVIIDHSFDNRAAGQPNISEFISRNYALVKADVANYPDGSNSFGLNKYTEKGIKQGAYVVAAGKAADLAGSTLDGSAKTLTIAVGGEMKVSDLLAALGINRNDYFTIVAIVPSTGFVYARLRVSADVALDDVIAAGNVADVFTKEGNVSVTPSVSGTNVVLTFGVLSANAGIIVSRKTDAGWIHNDVQLAAPSSPNWCADDALPTYPVGTQRFLNGGGDASADVPEPAPTLAAPVITKEDKPSGGAEVEITAADGADIYYTTDGTTPTSASTQYSAAFSVNDGVTVKAIAVLGGLTSQVASLTIS